MEFIGRIYWVSICGDIIARQEIIPILHSFRVLPYGLFLSRL
jgi:hypothetical protein